MATVATTVDFMRNLREHISTVSGLSEHSETIHNVAQKMIGSVKSGGTIFWMGNGGSAADAQHLAAELIGRFKQERKTIPSLSLSTDSSVLTCLTNDYDYSILFSRQLEGLCRSGDVVVGLSTSGNSENILKGILTAKKKNAYTVGLTGIKGQRLADVCDDCIIVPSSNTSRI